MRKRIERSGPGWVFTPVDFVDLTSPRHVGVELTRLERRGEIRRLARGLYDSPRRHPQFGLLAPNPEAIAQALARRGRTKFQPSEAAAANMLRLSEQVPARSVYRTDGRGRKVQIGRQTIELRPTAARKLRAAEASNLVFAALRGIGKANVTNRRVAHLRTMLSEKDRRQLLKDLPLAPAWMHPYLRYVAGDAKVRS
jgi:hypothetical protein